MILNNRGTPQNPIWILLEAPYSQDAEKGYLLSSTMGWIFDKILLEAGLAWDSLYFNCFKPDLEAPTAYRNIIGELQQFKPPFIVTLGDCTKRLLPFTEKRTKKSIPGQGEVSLEKWSGSLLTSPFLSYSHYVIPMQTPDWICSNWAYRDIFISIDLGHVKEEYDYYRLHNALNPLPSRTLGFNLSADDVLQYLYDCRSCNLISVDIETIRPKKGLASVLAGSPGYLYTWGVAKSATDGISFNMWNYPELERLKIWQSIDWLLRYVPQLGQNYFSFDSHLQEGLGFGSCLWKCHDTMLRHHILWPELPHKLQFLTKQYTREPYYKDEGRNWNPRNLSQLFRYNALDVTVTFEVYEAQEKEFGERSYLLR